MKIRTILIEDESPAMETMELYLKKYCPDIQVVGKAMDARSAIELLQQQKCELVFMDVELPYGNAFDILEKVGAIPFHLVFVSAYDQYALNALNHKAVHYILKPIDIEELIKAVEKVKEQLNIQQQLHDAPKKHIAKNYHEHQNKKFVFPHLNGFDLIEVSQIIRCQADDNYTKIFLQNGTSRLISKTLKKVEQQLNELGFLRVHKSHLVNLNHIVSYQKGNLGSLIMSDGSEVSITSEKKAKLLKLLDLN